MTATALAMLDRHDLMPQEDADNRQYLTFHLADECYGIDILKVQEIRGWTRVTVIPNIPATLRGVLNLRGAIVPVIDLRVQFGLARSACDETTVMIMVWVQGKNSGRTIGMVVDSLSDVIQVQLSEIQPAPDFGAANAAFVSGLINTGTGMTLLLDVDRLPTEVSVM